MTFWQRLTATFRPPTLQHPLFGQMTFMDIRPPGATYWEGAATFQPTHSSIEITVDGDRNGPFEGSVTTWNEITTGYPLHWPEIEAVLARAYADWFRDARPLGGVGRFTLNSLSIPLSLDQGSEWELTYDCTDDREHIFSVRMRGWTPDASVSIDG